MIDKLKEVFLMLAGVVASVGAYVDTGKAWLSLVILSASIGLDIILERLRDLRDKEIS